jgi:predicted ATPase
VALILIVQSDTLFPYMSPKTELTFRAQYRSIKDLPQTPLPGFCVLTGVNGSGKSHLLEAIEQGKVAVEGVPHNPNVIRRFDWMSFAPQISDQANPANLRQQREAALATVLESKQHSLRSLPVVFQNLRITGDVRLTDPAWLLQADEPAILDAFTKSELNGADVPTGYTKHFIQHRENCVNNFRTQIRPFGQLERILVKRSETTQQPILGFTESEIRAEMPITWTPDQALQFQIADWFAAWHGTWEYNKINRYYATQEGEKDRHYCSDEEFRKRYGQEPWDLTNRILSSAGVRYQFNRPTSVFQNLEANFHLRLVDPADGTEVQVNDLSSGEKILLTVALLLYQTTGEMGLAGMPQLLLLDEIDAPLHPSFTRVLLEILDHELVQKCGIRVILTTHSPSTVALAPEGSVFELVRMPREIRSTTPSQATQILSSGFVSITPRDIIVITEASSDAEYLQAVQESLVRRSWLPDNPPLKFIAASKKRGDGVGGGCTQVTNWAPKLHELGLERFRGLIDRDSGNVENDVVKVLARYSIENYIYDPLTLAAFMIHRGVKAAFTEIQLERDNAVELLELDQPKLQSLVDQFCDWLARESADIAIENDPKVAAAYALFPTLNIPKWWIDMPGHNLEALVKKHLNPLGQQKQRGALIKSDRDEIVSFQSKVLPELISQDLINICKRLHVTI